MTTVATPWQHANQADLKAPYALAEMDIALHLAEVQDFVSEGVVSLWGDLAGSGSDTLRIRRVDGLGYAASMSTPANEHVAVTASDLTTGLDSLTIARHGLAFEESQLEQILADATWRSTATLDAIAPTIAASVVAKLRSLVCTEGATFSDTIGSTGTDLTFTNWLSLVAAFEERDGYGGQKVIAVLKPKQLTQLKSSWITTANFQFPEVTDAVARIGGAGYRGQFLGIDVYTSGSVTDDSTDFSGFAMMAGKIGWGRASTAGVQLPAGADPMHLPNWGTVIHKEVSSGKVRLEGNTYIGVGSVDDSVAYGTKILSQV